jgi:L-threonylcarbamoyladenylate synthase
VVNKVTIADAVINSLKENEKALSPGMKYRHYAPKAELVLLDGGREAVANYIKKEGISNIAVIAYSGDAEYLIRELSSASVYSFGARENEELQAHNLFSLLRDIDKKSYNKIYAPLPEKSGVGLAIYNRMIRAAAHKIIKL